jgi:hypothetical protein
VVRNKGQNVQVVSKEFLRRVALFLWNTGEGGLFLEHFLEPKGKVTCWGGFASSYLNMSLLYTDYAGGVLGAALQAFYIELSRMHMLYPALSVKTFVFIVQEKLGLLKNLGPVMEADPTSNTLSHALSVSREELMDFFMSEMKKSSPTEEGDAARNRTKKKSAMPSKRTYEPTGSSEVHDNKKSRGNERPPLLGRHPCHKWLRGQAPCKGKECGQDPRHKKPHSFAECDKGEAAAAFSAWVRAGIS